MFETVLSVGSVGKNKFFIIVVTGWIVTASVT